MDFAENVKSQVDIVRTVGEYVRLRRAGPRWVGLCPFHTEKTPSFGVTPAYGIFKCFGCGAGGDVIKFIQEIEQLTFWEALKALAERNGIPLPQRREHNDADTELRAALFEMYEAAARVYADNLFGNAGSEVRDYLGGRGLTASVAQQFELGFSEPSWDALFRSIGRKYTNAQVEASGLFGKREDGGFYDKFRGRLMFPIHNESGKVIGFGGRALKADEEPKYLNSPETPIYKKSAVLYNLHRAKETIRKADSTVLVEGYMDVIGVSAAGVRNVVASCGTALTPGQIRSMKRHSENIFLSFDPDAAGASATERSLQLLLDEGMHVRVLALEGGLDPDEFIRKHGVETYKQRLQRSANYFLWLADRARKTHGTATAEARMAGYEALLLPAIRRISDRLQRAAVATEVADYLGLERSLVLAEFRGMRAGGAPRGPAPHKSQELPARERLLIRTVVANPDARFLFEVLRTSECARGFRVWPLFEKIAAIHSVDDGFTYGVLESQLADDEKKLLSEIALSDKSGEVMTAEQAVGFAQLLEEEDFTIACRHMERRIQEAEKQGNIQEALRLMQELSDRKRANRQTGA
ncbi:MAG TPA: DNA primase [Bryobacteraceae bacterium]|nr:DNA primase [Bryobacteraceae bacterium]